jgi:hypothetical protein
MALRYLALGIAGIVIVAVIAYIRFRKGKKITKEISKDTDHIDDTK